MYEPEDEKESVLNYFDKQVQKRIGEFEASVKELEEQIQTQTPNNPDVINLFD